MNARALLVFAAVLAGCQPIAPGPARYSCSRELPAESQCASGWRCGLDGFCFDPSGPNAVTLKCEDPQTDCPTGWRCGVDGTCFDPADAPPALRCTDAQRHCASGARCSLDGTCFDPARAPATVLRCSDVQLHCPSGWRCSLEGTCFDPANPGTIALPCSAPETDCPTGWKCGLDARCLAPDVAGPWRCEDTARDCTGGWTCGAAGLCFDRADAGRVACRVDTVTDCRDDWRCGIDGLCQQRDAGAAWPCRDDSHCEAAWRCGPDGRCLDPSADALRPNDGMPQGQRLDLGWPAGFPDEVVLDEELPSLGCGDGEVRSFVGAARFGRRVELFAIAPHGGPGLSTGCDGGDPMGFSPLLRGRVDFPGEAPLELAHIHGAAVVRVDGGVRRFMLEGEEAVRELTFVPGDFKKMRTSRPMNRVLLISDPRISELAGITQAQPLNTAPLVAIDGGAAIINDALVVKSGIELLLVAATDQGLFAKPLQGSAVPWTHVVWTTPRASMRELRIAPQDDGGMALMTLVRDPSGTASRVWTYSFESQFVGFPNEVQERQTSPYVMSSQWMPSPAGVHRLVWAEHYVFCTSEARAFFQGVGVAANTSAAVSFLQCDEADGGVQLRRTVVDPFSSGNIVAPEDQVTPMTSSARWMENDDRSLVMIDSSGGLFVASTKGRSLSLRPVLPASTPEAVTGRIGELVQARTAGRGLLLSDAVPQVRMLETHFVSSGDAGLMRVDDTMGPSGTRYRLLAGIDGRPDLSVMELEAAQGKQAVLLLPGDAGPFGRDLPVPVQALATAVTTGTRQVASVGGQGDGGLWFITQGDQLLVAPLGAPVPVDLNALFTRPQFNGLPAARLAITPLPGADLTHVLGLPADATAGATYGQALVVAAGRLFLVRAENPVVWRTSEPLETPSEILKAWADGRRVRVGDREGRVTSFPSRVTLSAALPGGARAWDYVDVCGVTYALATSGLWRLAASPGAPVGSWTPVPVPGGVRFTTSGALYTDGAGLLAFDEHGQTVNVTALTCAQPL